MEKQCEQRDKDNTLVALHFWTLKIKSGSVDGDVKVARGETNGGSQQPNY